MKFLSLDLGVTTLDFNILQLCDDYQDKSHCNLDLLNAKDLWLSTVPAQNNHWNMTFTILSISRMTTNNLL